MKYFQRSGATALLQPTPDVRTPPTATRSLAGRRPSATVVYKSLPEYRVSFYEGLRAWLAQRDVELRLIHGQPEARERTKRDTGEIAWAHQVPNRVVGVGRRSLYWQPCLPLLRDTDLIIVEQASKLLLNYVLLARQLLGGTPVAYWGHGRNVQVHRASRVGEAVKAFTSRHVHWWFAYTAGSAATVRALGYPEDRITNVQNAADTAGLRQAAARVTPADLEQLRKRLGLKGRHVALFIGSLYAEKGLTYLLEAAHHLRRLIPDFELLVVGAGPDQAQIADAAREFDWIHYAGPQFGDAKAPYFLLADVALLPGAMGLALLDAFALDLPMVTLDLPNHAPEIEYLVDGVNGLMLPRGTRPSEYAAAVARLLGDDEMRGRLVAGCRAAADTYTLERMIARFGGGILDALAARGVARRSAV